MHPVTCDEFIAGFAGNGAAWGVVMAASMNAHLPILLPVAALKRTHTSVSDIVSQRL